MVLGWWYWGGGIGVVVLGWYWVSGIGGYWGGGWYWGGIWGGIGVDTHYFTISVHSCRHETQSFNANLHLIFSPARPTTTSDAGRAGEAVVSCIVSCSSIRV